jgi:hypothetical protein
MSNSLITFAESRNNFFDRKIVQDALGRGVAGAMSKIGSFTRTTAQRSMRPARRLRVSEMGPELREYYKQNPDRQKPFVSSLPGEAPRARTKRLKRSIFYAYDVQQQTSVIGPVYFPGSRSADSPSVLEFGGESYVSLVEPPLKKKKGKSATDAQAEGLRQAAAEGKLKKSSRHKPNIVQKRVRVEPRPFMRPALNLVRPRIQPQFRNLLR